MDTGGNITSLGTISNSGQLVSMTDDSLTLTIVDGIQGYSIVLPAGAPTLIADPNFPNGCSSIATLDSRSVANVPNSRNFQVCQLLAGGTWSPVIQGAKENSSDLLVAVDVLNGVLILWGSQHMEFWQDNGTAPNPYGRINGASQTWGLAAKYSRAALVNTMVFLGQNPQGGVQVLMLNGYTPVRISTSDIEDIFSKFAVFSDAIALTYMIDGHPMYQLTFPSAQRSFLYDANTSFWFEVQTGVAATARHYANLGVVFNSKNFVADSMSGNIYLLDPNVFTDNGTPIKRQISSRHIRMDGNTFNVAEIVLEMETGVGLDFGQGSDPQIMMQVSRDGGRTFGPERWKPMGKKGQYFSRVHWNRFNDARDYVFQWTVTDPVKFVVTGGQATPAPGTEALAA
jgi:low affinity Fe/Cu permease